MDRLESCKIWQNWPNVPNLEYQVTWLNFTVDRLTKHLFTRTFLQPEPGTLQNHKIQSKCTYLQTSAPTRNPLLVYHLWRPYLKRRSRRNKSASICLSLGVYRWQKTRLGGVNTGFIIGLICSAPTAVTILTMLFSGVPDFPVAYPLGALLFPGEGTRKWVMRVRRRFSAGDFRFVIVLCFFRGENLLFSIRILGRNAKETLPECSKFIIYHWRLRGSILVMAELCVAVLPTFLNYKMLKLKIAKNQNWEKKEIFQSHLYN